MSMSTLKNDHEHNLVFVEVPSGFRCKACLGEKIHDKKYECKTCGDEFHWNCGEFIKRLLMYGPSFKCNRCKERGFGAKKDKVHEVCSVRERTSEGPEIFGRTFELLESRPILDTYCNACGGLIKGYYYRSGDHKRNLHPCCTQLPPKLSAANDQFPWVDKKLELYLKKGEFKSECLLCNKKHTHENPNAKDLSYVSSCKKYRVHVYCAMELMNELNLANNGNIFAGGGDATMVLDLVESKKDLVESKKAMVESKMDLAALKMDMVELKIDLVESKKGMARKSNIGGMVWKIAKTVLLMIISTLMGDPTFGLVHVFGALI